jgi:hypothetical protein
MEECEAATAEAAAVGRERNLEVIIRTTENGYNAGRSYIYRSTRQGVLMCIHTFL